MRHILMPLVAGLLLSASTQAQRPAGPQSNNPLLNASFWQEKPGLDAVKAAVEKGANPAEFNGNAFDPVVMAINAGASNEAIIYLLEQKGNDVNKITHDSRNYIHWSASKGNTVVMEYLLGKGSKVSNPDSHGSTPIMFAAGGGQQDTKVYDLLISKGANLKTELNHDGANALLVAIGNDPEFKVTDYFVSKGLPLQSKDAAGNTAFDYAARAGNIKNMKLLQSKGVKHTNNALIFASQGGRRGGNTLDVFQYLETLGIKPTVTAKNGDNVLHALVRRPGQNDIIKYFIGKGVNVNQTNEDGNNVFMNAAASNRDTALIALLKAQVKDINHANKTGATALSLAVRGNAPEVVEYLLNQGASLKTTDAKGNNLVYYLFESYSPRNTKEFDGKLALLKSKGLDIATPQQDGSTLYHLAVAKNDLGLLKQVQTYGADVNAKNKEGMTALHKAAMIAKDDAALKYLLSIGAKKEIGTSFNETAHQLAAENEYLTKQNISVDFLK